MQLPEKLIFKAIAAALGDADEVLQDTKRWKSVGRWKWWQSSQAVGLAAAGTLIPGTWLVAAPASVVFTYRKMAHIAWAIGQDMNAEVEPVNDILLITGLWTGAISTDTLAAAGAACKELDLEALKASGTVEELAVTRSLLEQAVPGFFSMLGVKLGVYVAGEVGAGFAPVVGATIIGGVTAATVDAFADHARQFYTHKRAGRAQRVRGAVPADKTT
ncbi:hypothetical protein [Streptomyces sp. NRRL S-813]|uniref:hypothetical protein n=1 Tax=Streptomyces sp. NRRL S-813 TaxID=1463919 RepID=UPI0004C21511|nr:hypothetical protein [Streptomyces sp. NRRL S-813]